MMSRRKGKAGELEFIRLMRDELGDETVRRNLDQVREGGADIIGLGNYSVEVKRCERMEFGKWITQACEQAGEKIPVVAWRRNGGKWRIWIEVDVPLFAEMVRESL